MKDGDELAELGQIPDFVPASEPSLPPPALPRSALSRGALHKRRAAALGLSAAWLITHLVVFGVRGDLRALPTLYTLTQIGVPTVLALCSLALALSSGRLGLGLGVRLLASFCVLGPLAYLVSAAGAPALGPTPAGEPFWRGVFVCFDLAIAWSVVPLLAAALVLRRAFPAVATLRATLVGAAAGLLSGAAINLHCSSVLGLHILLGHGVPVLIATLTGTLLVAHWSKV